MITLTPTIPFNPPAALALAYLPTLPTGDRKTDRTAFSFPLCFYPGSTPSPKESVYAPTTPVEVNNYVNLAISESPFVSGTTINTVPIYTEDYTVIVGEDSVATLFANFPLIKNRNKTNTLKLYLNNNPIAIKGIVEDSSLSWTIKVKNGVVYRDTVIKRNELDNVAVNFTWLNEVYGDTVPVRLIYTIPNEILNRDITGDGIKTIGPLDEELLTITNSEGFHIGNGDIVIADEDIVYVNKITEISAQTNRVIFSGSISGNYTGNGITVTNWNGSKGTFRLSPAPADGAYLIVDYTKKENTINYRGFYDEYGKWQALDLNPQKGHTYNTGIDTPTRINRESEDLLYRTVSLYLLPTAVMSLDAEGNPTYAMHNYSAYMSGSKPYWWSPLRHYVSAEPQASASGTISTKQVASWGYGKYDIDLYASEPEFSAQERGIPLELESAILIGQIRVLPKPKLEVEDARRFSGLLGEYDRKSFTGAFEDPRTTRWDTSSWEGLSTSLAGTVIVEMSQTNIEGLGLNHIENVVKKHLPPGIVPIIKAK